MKYVFHESIKESAYGESMTDTIKFWILTFNDAIKSLAYEHYDKYKGDKLMKNNTDVLMDNKVFAWIAAATGLLLMIPLIAMQFTNEVNWTLSDFVVMGVLIFVMASLFVYLARKFKKNRIITAVVLGLIFMYVWAELAVGIFTSIGS